MLVFVYCGDYLEFTKPLHVTTNASMTSFTILGLDNLDGNITADYVTVTFAGMRLYQRPQESTLRVH
jgi:hypothetical protein